MLPLSHTAGADMGRTILGILVGLVAMWLVTYGIEAFSHHLYPPPPGLDPRNPDDLINIMAAMPLGAYALLVVAWCAGAFAGGGVAARVAAHPRAAAVAVGLLTVSGVVMMILLIPQHPVWVSACGLLLPVPFALLAAKLFGKRTDAD